MIIKTRKYKLAIKFFILSFLILGGFETIALVGFRIVSLKLIKPQIVERGDNRIYLKAQEIYRQFKRYDVRTEKGRLGADQYISSAGILLDVILWIADSDGIIYPSGFAPEARFLKAEPVPGYPNKFKPGSQIKPSKSFNLFRSPLPDIGELFFRIPFEEADGRNSYVHYALKIKDPGFERIYFMDHLPAMLAGYVGILSSLPLMLIILYLLVMRPISRLQTSTTQIASGELSHRHLISGNDEIADLGRGFNHMADQVEKMIQSTREVSGRLSHELRSPMSRLNLKKDLILLELEKIESGGAARILAEEMSKEIEQMDVLIDQMLDFARLDAVIAQAPKRVLDLTDILNDTIEVYMVDIQHHAIDMVTQIPSAAMMVRSSERDLIAVFQNLMGNALKFTPDKGIIDIRLTCSNKAAVLRFANTCEPLKEAALTRIFEPFYRIEDNSKPGNGLGLSIVRKIVEHLNGTISASAWEGKGICFEMKLPLARS